MRDLAPDDAGAAPVVTAFPRPPLAEARGLRLHLGGQPLVDGIDCAFATGRRTVIMGANGSGKSLLLRMMHGLIRPTEGQVLWRGRQLDRAGRDAQALVFQSPVMLRRSVLANLRFALAVQGVPRRDRRARAEAALEQARLTALAHRPARVLSGGEQQRLAIARALACRPELLLLDEPTASLDPASTALIEEAVNAAHASGVTVPVKSDIQPKSWLRGENPAKAHHCTVGSRNVCWAPRGFGEKVRGAAPLRPLLWLLSLLPRV